MVNINVAKNSERFKFIFDILGAPHMCVFKDGKEISLWYVTEDDKKTIDEMEKENEKCHL